MARLRPSGQSASTRSVRWYANPNQHPAQPDLDPCDLCGEMTGDGAIPGPTRRASREFEMNVLLTAANEEALSWGLEWWSAALMGSTCRPGYLGDTLCVYAACPVVPNRDSLTPEEYLAAAQAVGDRLSRQLFDVTILEVGDSPEIKRLAGARGPRRSRRRSRPGGRGGTGCRSRCSTPRSRRPTRRSPTSCRGSTSGARIARRSRTALTSTPTARAGRGARSPTLVPGRTRTGPTRATRSHRSMRRAPSTPAPPR